MWDIFNILSYNLYSSPLYIHLSVSCLNLGIARTEILTWPLERSWIYLPFIWGKFLFRDTCGMHCLKSEKISQNAKGLSFNRAVPFRKYSGSEQKERISRMIPVNISVNTKNYPKFLSAILEMKKSVTSWIQLLPQIYKNT